MRFLFSALFLLLLGGWGRAEEMLPLVQRELRARKFYFGEIHGRATNETVAAIAKFQTARGIDNTGDLDGETLRALGLPAADAALTAERSAIAESCLCVRLYLEAWQSGEWPREAEFFAPRVDYFDDRKVDREFIRDWRAQENLRWPQRKATLLQRIASRRPDRENAAQVTARVRTEVAAPSGPSRARLEDLIFWLEKMDGRWRITAVKLLE